MNTQYNALEKSLLSDHTGLVARGNQPLSLADRHPRLYKLVLMLAGVAGYGFICLFPVSVLVLSPLVPGMILDAENHYHVVIALLSIAWVLFCGWMSWYIWRSRPSLPAGRPLKVEEAPMLFDMLEELRQQHSAPKIDCVRIIRDYHIEAIKTPANGYPFKFTHTLLIGLPMLQSLTPKQFKYAAQRQIIHLASMYRRNTGWARFLSPLWDQYRSMYQNSWHPASVTMRVFFMIYSPLYRWLAKYACCEQSYYADLTAAGNANANSVAEMIVTQALQRKYLAEQFWPGLLQCAYQHVAPPYLPYFSIEQHVQNELDSLNQQQLLDSLLYEQLQTANQPGLRQRLDRLGIHDIQLPPQTKHSAIRFLVEQARSLIIKQFDDVWIKSSCHDWRKKYLQGQEERTRLQNYQQQIDNGVLPDKFVHEYIQLIKKYLSVDEALPLYRKVLQLDFEDARIGFEIGRSLLRQNDAHGIDALLTTMRKDPSFTVMACQLIIQYYVRIGDSRNAQVYRRKALAYQVEAA